MFLQHSMKYAPKRYSKTYKKHDNNTQNMFCLFVFFLNGEIKLHIRKEKYVLPRTQQKIRFNLLQRKITNIPVYNINPWRSMENLICYISFH